MDRSSSSLGFAEGSITIPSRPTTRREKTWQSRWMNIPRILVRKDFFDPILTWSLSYIKHQLFNLRAAIFTNNSIRINMASLSNSRHPITVLCTRRHLNITGVEQETSYEWHGSFISMAILDEACLKICSNTDLKFKEAKKTLAFFIVVAIEDYKTEITTIRGGKWNILEVGMSMAVKLTKSTPKYTKAPRWEREGILYKADRGGDVNAKYTMTLLGMPTIFLEPTEQVSAIFESRNQIQKTDLTRFLAARPRVIIKQNDLIKYTW